MVKNKIIKTKKNKPAIFFYVTILVVVASVVAITAVKYNENKTIKCIGENSKLFIQPGSKDCQEQESILEDKIKYFNVVNCFSEREKCSGIDISLTPIWIINNQKHYKVYNLTKLKELTNC